jgi:hypothetical protein
MLIAEDLLLLAYDDATGKPDGWLSDLDSRLAAALLLELALAGRVTVADDGTTTSGADAKSGADVKPGTVVVLDDRPTGQPVLDGALAVVAERPRTPQDLLGPVGKGVRDAPLAGLVERRVLRREDGRILGLFPTTSWPSADTSHEIALRAECEDVLLRRRDPRPETAALLSLAAGTVLVKRLVPAEHRKQAEARAKELAEESWATEAVKKAVDDLNAVILTTVIMPTIFAPTIISP